MMTNNALKIQGEARGNIAVELALVLPLLFLLSFGVAEYAMGIHANNIIVNISREGANLASRSTANPQTIMDALASTAGPLDMNNNGIMYITRLQGQADGTVGAVEQHRRLRGSFSKTSKVWTCSSGWDAGSCSPPDPNNLPRVDTNRLNLTLNSGELVDVVEVFYNYQPVTSYVMRNDSVLYSRTVF